MKNRMKKVFAAVLAVALCLSFAGCYDENKTWAAKKGDDTLPIGAYIYYLNSAYSEAMGKVPSGEEVLKAKVEDEDAQTWIKNRAVNYLNAYYFISNKFDELGLELTQEELDTVQSNTDSMWSFYKTSMEEMGIAKESYNQAFTLYNAKYQKVMKAMYGKDGELAVSDDDLKTYFTDNYYSYEYFTVSLTKTDDDGNSVDMTDDEKKEAKSKLEDYIKKINAGDMTVSDAASEYAEEALGNADNSTYYAPSPTPADSMTDPLKSAVENAEDNVAALTEGTTNYFVVRRLPIAEKFAETNEDETQRFNLISRMKGDEFTDYVLEQAKSVEGVEINDKALNSVKISSMVNDNNKNGTSSASSEADSDDSSSAVSSEAGSDDSSAPESSAASKETTE